MAWCRVNIHNDSPVAIYDHVFSREWHPSIRPLGCITPEPNKALLHKGSRGSRTEVSARDSCYFSGFKIGLIFATGADLKGTLTYSVIVVVISVSACGWIERSALRKEQTSANKRLVGSVWPNIVKLSVKSIVEFQSDAWIVFSEVSGGIHFDVVELKTSKPPDIVESACDVWECPSLFVGHRVHVVCG